MHPHFKIKLTRLNQRKEATRTFQELLSLAECTSDLAVVHVRHIHLSKSWIKHKFHCCALHKWPMKTVCGLMKVILSGANKWWLAYNKIQKQSRTKRLPPYLKTGKPKEILCSNHPFEFIFLESPEFHLIKYKMYLKSNTFENYAKSMVIYLICRKCRWTSSINVTICQW